MLASLCGETVEWRIRPEEGMTAVSALRASVGGARRSDLGVSICWAVFILWFAASLWGFLEPGSGGPPLLAQLLLLLFVAMHGSLLRS